MLLMVVSVGSATIGESSPYTSRWKVRLATVLMLRLRLRMPGSMPCFSRCSRSSGNAGLFRRSSQIFSPSSTWRMWMERLVAVTVPARKSIRSFICSAVIDVVPPERTMEPVRAWTPSLPGGSRNERPPPAPPPPRCGQSVALGSPAAAHRPAPAGDHGRQQRGLEPGNLVILGDVDDEPVRQDLAELRRLRGLEVERRVLELVGPRALRPRRRRAPGPPAWRRSSVPSGRGNRARQPSAPTSRISRKSSSAWS